MATIYCCCDQAKSFCELSCSRWPGKNKPDRICNVVWRKDPVPVFVQLLADYLKDFK